jgi:hypothetical protein
MNSIGIRATAPVTPARERATIGPVLKTIRSAMAHERQL